MIETLARLGYATKGVVYGLIGVLAVMTALGLGGQTTGTKGALRAIAAQPYGQALLIIIDLGLAGYALWRFVEAVLDPEHKGDDKKGIAKRFGYAISGVIYTTLAYTAIELVLEVAQQRREGSSQAQTITARVLAQPFGAWLVGLVGVVIIGVGFYQFYKAYSMKFRRELKLRQMGRKEEIWAVRISRFGLAARGVVFVMFGFFLIQAAKQSQAAEVKGLDGILQTIAQQSYGKLLLTIVALGLVAYGVYMFVQARYRRIPT
jgi:uncharacterized membrane protein YidH (DUF202 family)